MELFGLLTQMTQAGLKVKKIKKYKQKFETKVQQKLRKSPRTTKRPKPR